jgi:predicted membrane-bound mannosyltransferase
MAFTVFIVVNVLFYSSFFTNYPKGVNDALLTLSLWRKRTHEHEHPWSQYVVWLIQEEGLLLFLGGIGALVAVWRANNRFAVFMAQFAFGLLAAYSLVGYKTPWIALNFIVPLALIGGYALEVFYQKLREFQQPWFLLAPAILIVAFCGYQMYQLNFVHYDDDQYVYVYAHTRRETLVMLEQIDATANKMKTGYDTGVAIVSPEYWPLPWYFRDYKRVGYYGKVVPISEPVIIGQTGQEEEIKATYGEQYQQIDSHTLNDPRILPDRNPGGSFSLRPGVDLLLYVRRDVAKPSTTK